MTDTMIYNITVEHFIDIVKEVSVGMLGNEWDEMNKFQKTIVIDNLHSVSQGTHKNYAELVRDFSQNTPFSHIYVLLKFDKYITCFMSKLLHF